MDKFSSFGSRHTHSPEDRCKTVVFASLRLGPRRQVIGTITLKGVINLCGTGVVLATAISDFDRFFRLSTPYAIRLGLVHQVQPSTDSGCESVVLIEPSYWQLTLQRFANKYVSY